MAKIEPDSQTGCWRWTANRDKDTYGLFKLGVTRRAHRVSYEHFVGRIPAGLVLDHLCRVRSCVNPYHLQPVTTRENLEAPGSLAPMKLNAAKTHCSRGHELAEWNRVPSAAKTGHRKCLACQRALNYRNNSKRKAELNLDKLADEYYARLQAAH
jgi:hypothetical protein